MLGFFQKALLQLLLAFDAVTGPGHGFETFGVDFFSAMDALAKTAFANAQQSPIHHLQKLAIVVALAKEKFFGVGTRGAIGNILRGIFVGGAAISLSAGNGTAQILLPGLEPFLERF
jgi:hypothetical protein